jgi:two-component system, chemotaxis family, chemotaxis protein CheY
MSLNILIVDDSATTRAIIKRTIMLSQTVASITEAPDGQAALEILTTQPVDLVFADLNMPRMNGVELTGQMRANPAIATVPVVIVSSESMESRIASLKAQGIAGYIKKPFTPEQIRNVIDELAGASHA